MNTIDINQKLTQFKKHWHPHQIGVVNEMQVLLAKVSGDFVWHHHEEEDELFQVVKGTLFIEFRDRTEKIEQGQIIIVPKGVEHRPYTRDGEEVHIMLFEKLSTRHTGNVEDEKTVTDYPKI